jgi:hypothetical protein
MIYTALAVVFILVCVGLGADTGRRAERPSLAAGIAAVMVTAQFAILMSQ